MNIEEIAHAISREIAINEECFVKQWLQENPTARISDYVLQYRQTKFGMEFSIGNKENTI